MGARHGPRRDTNSLFARAEGRPVEGAAGRDQRSRCYFDMASPEVFFADFFFVLLIFMSSPELMASPLLAAWPVVVIGFSADWARAADETNARAVVAMISLRMRKTSEGWKRAGP